MYGAIIGDIVGSRFEFDMSGKTKDFDLFTRNNTITDDTVMTVAIAEALIYLTPDTDMDVIKSNVVNSMVRWAEKYPDAGYGERFYGWLFHSKAKNPYGSCGNGSAMRVSAVGWLYDSLERTHEVAKATAEVTHNHPEGINGATCTAEVIFLARTGHDKESIKKYVEKYYNYDLNTTVDQLRERHEHIETCQDSLPKALVSLFEGDSFEDVIRNAVSLGGDTDTIAAIAGAMAEAYYGIPVDMIKQATDYIPQDIQQVITCFYEIKTNYQDPYKDNKYIKMAVNEIHHQYNVDTINLLFNILLRRIADKGTAPTPMVNVNNVQIDIGKLVAGESITLNEDLRLKIDTMTDGNGNLWIPLFTDEEEIKKGKTTNILLETSIDHLVKSAYNNEEVSGLVINPFGQSFAMPKNYIKIILDNIDNLSETNCNE